MQQVQPVGEAWEDPRLALDLEILRGVCHAFGSTPDLDEACRAVTRWVRAALPDELTSLGIFVRDHRGRLTPVEGYTTGGAALMAARKAAFRDGKPRFLRLDRPERGAALFPLVCRGEPVGLIQIIGPPATVLSGWSILEAISSQFATVLKNLEDRDKATREVSLLEQITSLMQELVRVDRSEDAVRAVMDACHAWDYQVAAWLSEGRPTELRFLGVRGLGKKCRNKLRSHMRVINRDELFGPGGRQRLASRFAATVGAKNIAMLVTKEAVLVLAGVPRSASSSLKILEVMLEDVLTHVGIVSLAHARNQNLDLGLAWAAHEIRQPLVSAKMFIDRLLQMPTGNDEEHAWLSNSLQEMERLIVLIEDVLRWSVGGASPNHAVIDLGALAEKVVRSRASEQERISFDAPGPITVSGDQGQLRAAIRNLIDNALSYSPGRVDVSVDRIKNDAIVSIRDHGPGIPPAERRRVFDPFVRGEMGLLARNGSGLGLFIARRVAEAHHGAIWLESNGKGSTFKIRLPAEKD